ncbi:hypothetical protein BKA81DRAFT_381263 [Phyllosticta paracitricarpa]|uniref:Uncharacterized protein n=1 Tax=Phyllosticta citricarpa TaxID=55181 RepID=A0ABR1MM32_9PEZI
MTAARQTVSLPSTMALFGVGVLFYLVVYPVFEYFRDPQQKYGDTRAIKDIHGHNTKCTKDGQYKDTAGEYFQIADVIDRKDHACKRKYLSAAYAIKNLEGWEAKVTDKTVRLMAHMDKCCTDSLQEGESIPKTEDINLDWRKSANYFSLDAIADIGLSERLGLLDTDDDRVTYTRPNGFKYTCHFRECLYDNARKQSYIVWSYDWYKVLEKLTNVFQRFRRIGNNGKMWDGIPPELFVQPPVKVWRRDSKAAAE